MKNKITLICILQFLLFYCSNLTNESQFKEIIQSQIQRYPQMQVQDLYKLAYQAAMGNIHLGVDPSALRNYLANEMGKIEASDNEELVEEISGDGLIRVNLRPYKASGGIPEKLFEAMMATTNTFHPQEAKISQYWEVIEKMAGGKSFPFNRSQLDSFFVTMQDRNFPAVHHSEEYINAYHPAYRVILKDFLPPLD